MCVYVSGVCILLNFPSSKQNVLQLNYVEQTNLVVRRRLSVNKFFTCAIFKHTAFGIKIMYIYIYTYICVLCCLLLSVKKGFTHTLFHL